FARSRNDWLLLRSASAERALNASASLVSAVLMSVIFSWLALRSSSRRVCSTARSVSPYVRPRSNSYFSFVRVINQTEKAPILSPSASIDTGKTISMGAYYITHAALYPSSCFRIPLRPQLDGFSHAAAQRRNEKRRAVAPPREKLSSEARYHALVDLARHADVVEVVLADEIESPRLVEIKDLAAFHVRSLARLDPERPRNVVKTDVPLRAQPPAMHRVENTAHVVLAQVHKRPRLDRVRATALKDERQIEADDVMPHELVTIGIEVFH